MVRSFSLSWAGGGVVGTAMIDGSPAERENDRELGDRRMSGGIRGSRRRESRPPAGRESLLIRNPIQVHQDTLEHSVTPSKIEKNLIVTTSKFL